MALPSQPGRFGIDLNIEGDLGELATAALALYPQAAMAAADRLERWGKDEIRKPVRAALGQRLANTVRGRVWPRRGETMTPAVSWWTNAPHILRAFEEGVTIKSASGFWLALPTENAPKTARVVGYSGRIRRGRNALIAETEKRYGALRYVQVHSRLALLVADGLRRRRGKRGGFSRASDAARRRGDFEDGVVMFILVPQVKLPRLYSLGAIERKIGSQGLAYFADAFREITERRFRDGD